MKSLPIGARLTLWYSAILAVVLAIFGFSAYFGMRNSVHRTVDEELQARVEGVRGLIERISRYGDAEDLRVELREHSELRGGGALLEVSDEKGNWLYRSPAIREYELPMQNASSPTTIVFKGMPLRILDASIAGGNRLYQVQVATPMDDFYGALSHFRILVVVAIPLLLLCAAGGGYWMSRRALAPVDQITNTARSITVHNLSSRLVIPPARDELQRLSETLNEMLERLDIAFHKIRQFTADASHELRTPIALMRTRAELALRKPRDSEDYRATVAQIHSELEKTSELIEKLMLLARADAEAETLQFCTADVTEIAREACAQGRILSEAKQIRFREELPREPMPVECDPQALRRLFLILIDNAVKYTQPTGEIEVTLGRQDGFLIGAVRDTGIGIAAEDLPHVFERFYRADKARSRDTGGVGLGLSIGRWIAEAHGGTIEVESSVGGGSVFEVRLPLFKQRLAAKLFTTG
jgi:heavy metal sensor kinase